jgi:CspA family cold shock protein
MSKGKDFRPRRRGFDDDEPMQYGDRSSNRSPRQPMAPVFPPADMEFAPQDTVDATVKWFKADKGFGFVELGNGSGDAFLHVGALQQAGYESVPPGAKLKVIASKTMKGMQVSRVMSVDTSTASAAPPPRSPRPFDGGGREGGGRDGGGRPQRFQPDMSNAVEIGGRVKWFDATKGFGFIAGDDGGKDIFIHVSVLRNAGLQQLVEEQPVNVKVVETPKGREAVSISLP